MSGGRLSCQCPLSCDSVHYGERLSKAALITQEEECKEFYKNNHVRLNVFYASLNKRVYDQQPKWRESTLLSYIGNELGLWLGLSLTTFCEILEKIMLLLKHVTIRLIYYNPVIVARRTE
ncbi:acid-sensing ion channel 4 [Caerostris darwini]|uniref:Acid-sensing ion channel 4 n=1 Tax=Caerostris darwini TaxID=1538125 RepID=A0AAV4RQQ3_9ARAC|nr:acid-sensing ion channel 4 [Caerostris darwini]